MKTLYKNSMFVGITLCVIIFLGYFLYVSAPGSFKTGTIFTIEQGKSLRSVSAILKSEHLIRSRVAFEAFVILYEGEKHIVPGDYLFENKMPVFEIAYRIAKGEHHLPPVKLTIPEGFTNTDIAQVCSTKLTTCNQDMFLLHAQGKQGYLFPDTYFLLASNTADDVIKLMSENYDKKIMPLRSSIASSGKTEREIITMASIIEGEAKGDTDRGVISSILWNRINKGMPLQVDIAPSTYKTKGLPSDPISNPGIEAIKAAIQPTVSPYLFYLHDVNGDIHYARTFEEHKANTLKYLKLK